ncbi:MAG: hypothetical protein RDV48_16105 [Candidatus Eremiobacteraeota bacterium]|nr:hypothetical protein [Candidatus Eremiobacteraeota bacterium]
MDPIKPVNQKTSWPAGTLQGFGTLREGPAEDPRDILEKGQPSPYPSRSEILRYKAAHKTASSESEGFHLYSHRSHMACLGLALALLGFAGVGCAPTAQAAPPQGPAPRERVIDMRNPVTSQNPNRFQAFPQEAPPLDPGPAPRWPSTINVPSMPSMELPPGMEMPPGMELPPDMQDSASFLQQMMKAKQDALRRAAEANATNPVKPDKNEAKTGTLSVNAHGYEQNGEYHPVKSIKITEYGNYKNRTSEQFSNYGHNPEQSLSLGTAKEGKWYTVTVNWEGGASRTYDVKMDGTSETFNAWYN